MEVKFTLQNSLFRYKNVLMNYITTYFWTVKINVNKNILKILKSWKVKYPSETGLLEGVIYFPWFQDFQNVLQNTKKNIYKLAHIDMQ